MSTKRKELNYCSSRDCMNSIKNNAWSRIKAEGWFFQHNGDVWCPDHIPDWVEAWRANKGKY